MAGPAWVGDMVMAQALFMKLKQGHPDAEIDVLAPGWSVPLIERMPEVTRAIELPIGHKQLKLLSRYQLGKSLRKRCYSLAIVTPRSFKSALVPFFAKAKKRRGYRGEMRYGLLNDIRLLDKSVLKQTVQRYVALAMEDAPTPSIAIPFPKLTIDRQNQQQLLNKLQLEVSQPVVGLMPGAEYGPAKQWPVDYYKELAEQLSRQGKQVWVFGSDKEKSVGDKIAESTKNIINLAGKTALVDVVDLIALTGHVVTNDSGLMHVACATGRKVIAIYGSSDPDYTPPLSDSATIMYKALACSPCFERTCKFGHTDCLKKITVENILNKLC